MLRNSLLNKAIDSLNIVSKLVTFYRLGLRNLFWVALYRIRIKRKKFVALMPIKKVEQFAEPDEQFFTPFQNTIVINYNQKLAVPPLLAFGWLSVNNNDIPNWLESVTTKKMIDNNQQHWSLLDDFSLPVGDIKTVWELSRFDWLINFALKYKIDRDQATVNTINAWLYDWCSVNPTNQGVNWKCGQEASIRVMHIAVASYLLMQHKTISTSLSQLLYEHLKRIHPTIHYAVAQDNNHGTSEAAALYIGALLLRASNNNKLPEKELKMWQKKGQYWLEERAKKLIATDGCFSQNSINYHRLMLDTLSLTEFMRRTFKAKPFTSNYYQKTVLATKWLTALVDPITGKAANLGLNDGANLLPLTLCQYDDYRPSVQWANSLFSGYFVYPQHGHYQQLCSLFTADKGLVEKKPILHTLNTCFHLLTHKHYSLVLRTPNRSFRPGCSDALHLDLTLNHVNILRDTGSYSYNCQTELQEYFPSVRAHNTIAFDDAEQMAKLSRFLYSDWLNCQVTLSTDKQIVASYLNRQGHSHQRQIKSLLNTIEVKDTFSGFKEFVTLRWHLAPLSWQLNDNTLSCEEMAISIIIMAEGCQVDLVEGIESRYYLQKERIPILTVTTKTAGTIKTIIKWSL